VEIIHNNVKYSVVEKDKNNDDNMGKIIYKKAIIEIDETMPSDLKKQCLFHECMHLVLSNIGEFELNNNESFVERFSNSVYNIVKDNKKVLLS